MATTFFAGCKEDEVSTLFDEEGVWVMTRYALDGGPLQELSGTARENAFKLKFDADGGVVQTAKCAPSETDNPNNAICQSGSGAQWFCECFAYAFEESTQAWLGFDPGSAVPSVSIDDAGGEGGATRIELVEVQGIASTYNFSPLPAGLFGSDGQTSLFQFQRKATASWESPPTAGVEGVTCEPCI